MGFERLVGSVVVAGFGLCLSACASAPRTADEFRTTAESGSNRHLHVERWTVEDSADQVAARLETAYAECVDHTEIVHSGYGSVTRIYRSRAIPFDGTRGSVVLQMFVPRFRDAAEAHQAEGGNYYAVVDVIADQGRAQLVWHGAEGRWLTRLLENTKRWAVAFGEDTPCDE